MKWRFMLKRKEDLFYDCVYLSPSGEKKRIDVAIRNIICCKGLCHVTPSFQFGSFSIFKRSSHWNCILNYEL